MRDLPRHQATENPDLFLLYEHYVNQAALEGHRNTPHFKEIIKGSIVPLLHTAAASGRATIQESDAWRSGAGRPTPFAGRDEPVVFRPTCD